MVVEEETMNSISKEQRRENLGYGVAGIALSGEVAVQRAGIDKPDLIRMDSKLMGDMDGQEATLKIRELYQIPVIYVTAFGDKETSKHLKTLPPEGIGYVVKPFTQEELGSEIKRLIG